MRFFPPLIALILYLSSCTTGVNLRYVDLDSTFHDNNSKVWVVNKLIIKEMNIAPDNDYQKDVIVFYENGVVCITPMKKIGHESPRRGRYEIDSQEKTMYIDFQDKEKWIIDIQYVTQDSMYLIRTNDDDSPIGIQLKPLPQL